MWRCSCLVTGGIPIIGMVADGPTAPALALDRCTSCSQSTPCISIPMTKSMTGVHQSDTTPGSAAWGDGQAARNAARTASPAAAHLGPTVSRCMSGPADPARLHGRGRVPLPGSCTWACPGPAAVGLGLKAWAQMAAPLPAVVHAPGGWAQPGPGRVRRAPATRLSLARRSMA